MKLNHYSVLFFLVIAMHDVKHFGRPMCSPKIGHDRLLDPKVPRVGSISVIFHPLDMFG